MSTRVRSIETRIRSVLSNHKVTRAHIDSYIQELTDTDFEGFRSEDLEGVRFEDVDAIIVADFQLFAEYAPTETAEGVS